MQNKSQHFPTKIRSKEEGNFLLCPIVLPTPSSNISPCAHMQDQPDYFPTMIRSEEKVKFLLGLQPNPPPGAVLLPRYALGAERPLEAFWRHVHVDPANQSAASGAHFCPEHVGGW